MLDAFGKGASEDIRAAKAELYGQMTWDPLHGRSLAAPPQSTTPAPSPPPSPKPLSKAGSETGARVADLGFDQNPQSCVPGVPDKAPQPPGLPQAPVQGRVRDGWILPVG